MTRTVLAILSWVSLSVAMMSGCDDSPMTRREAVEIFASNACAWIVQCDDTDDSKYTTDNCMATMRNGLCGDGSCDEEYRQEDQLAACLEAHAIEAWPCERYPAMPDACRTIFRR